MQQVFPRIYTTLGDEGIRFKSVDGPDSERIKALFTQAMQVPITQDDVMDQHIRQYYKFYNEFAESDVFEECYELNFAIICNLYTAFTDRGIKRAVIFENKMPIGIIKRSEFLKACRDRKLIEPSSIHQFFDDPTEKARKMCVAFNHLFGSKGPSNEVVIHGFASTFFSFIQSSEFDQAVISRMHKKWNLPFSFKDTLESLEILEKRAKMYMQDYVLEPKQPATVLFRFNQMQKPYRQVILTMDAVVRAYKSTIKKKKRMSPQKPPSTGFLAGFIPGVWDVTKKVMS
jgi:hypothetical protein